MHRSSGRFAASAYAGNIVSCSLCFSSGPSNRSCFPSLSHTSHVRTPGTRRSSGIRSDTSRSSSAPSDCFSSAATTASSSIGLNVHVLYTSRPPTFRTLAARTAILS